MVVKENIYYQFSSQSLSNNDRIVDILIDFGLIKISSPCPGCNNPMSINRDASRSNQCRYFCSTCKKRYEIISQTVFKGFKIRLIDILSIIAQWNTEKNLVQIERILKISKKTLIKVQSIIRQKIKTYEDANQPLPIGSDNPVEVDETVISKRKYNRGRLVKEQWLFGGIERDSGNFFLKTVPKRDAETLGNIIRDFVEEGSTIYSDQWRAYVRFFNANPEYTHRMVNHSIEFVNSEDRRVHTQNIESLWSILKRFLRKRSLNDSTKLEEYLAEFIFRRKNRSLTEYQRFEKILKILF